MTQSRSVVELSGIDRCEQDILEPNRTARGPASTFSPSITSTGPPGVFHVSRPVFRHESRRSIRSRISTCTSVMGCKNGARNSMLLRDCGLLYFCPAFGIRTPTLARARSVSIHDHYRAISIAPRHESHGSTRATSARLLLTIRTEPTVFEQGAAGWKPLFELGDPEKPHASERLVI